MHTNTFVNISLAIALGAVLAGCSGDTDGGSQTNTNFPGSQYVADSSAGSITIEVNEPVLAVGEISGFSVGVKNGQGEPVPGIAVACDSEKGVAIIEPTTGREITDSSGHISGKLGCAMPGSLQFACRLPVGMNKRQLVGIKCTGDVPQGFNGFPGAAGGGLGSGGVDIGDIGGTDNENIRVTAIIAQTVIGESYQIDTIRSSCGTGTTRADEPFSDDSVRVTVVNNTNSTIKFTSLKYFVPNGGGAPDFEDFESEAITLDCEVPASGGSQVCQSLFLQLSSGTIPNPTNTPVAVTGKKFYGATNVTTLSGFNNITFELTGTSTATGEEVTVTGKMGFAFNDYNNC